MICNRLKECIEDEIHGNAVHVCTNRKDNCMESADRRSQVKCEEHQRKYVLKNTKGNFVICYKVDGGMIVEDKSVPPELRKCDYLYVVLDRERHVDVIMTELKGIDVGKALEQLYRTLKLFPDTFNTCSHVYARVIATSGMPRLNARPEYRNLVTMLKGKYHGNLKIVERQFYEADTELEKE